MRSGSRDVPDWDLEQLEVILDEPHSWQLVVAGPGAGKSEVALQRIASLVDDGIPPSRILLISFTRTAVAELRDRLVAFAAAGELAGNVRISTIDSHAWSLRAGFEEQQIGKLIDGDSYDLSISRTVDLFRSRNPELLEFVSSMESVVIDEAQDIVGIRADLVLEILKALSQECGVTVLADPAQAIYGFTSDARDEDGMGGSLLSRLAGESPRVFVERKIERIYRIQNEELVDVFQRTRREVEEQSGTDQHVSRVISVIRETAPENLGNTSYEALAKALSDLQDEPTLVLFRRRADVLVASSYLSVHQVQHRLRMSGTPVVIRPWLGWLFAEYTEALITFEEFQDLWGRRLDMCASPFEGETQDDAWALLHKLAAGKRPGTVDLVQLRQVLSRSRPPVEVCLPDLGTTGPILGTIHASKGRQSDTVVLVMPQSYSGSESDSRESRLEEGRVYYVGATRARRALMAARNGGSPASYLDSGRVYRHLRAVRNDLPRVQMEIGRQGDVDPLAHLSWTSADRVQLVLARSANETLPLQAVTRQELGYVQRLVLEEASPSGSLRQVEIGQMGELFKNELSQVWSSVDRDEKYKPADRINNLYLVGITSVALSDDARTAARSPFSESGFALAPVIKGFPAVYFQRRRYGRYSW